MKYKSLLASVIVAPSIAVGGLWVYQASRFEASVNQNLKSFQNFLQGQGISLTYEAVKTSPFSFKVHLVNPVISGTFPDFDENWKDIKGAFSLTGEMTARFNPIANTVIVAQTGDSQLKVEGPIETDMSFPNSSQSIFSIKRKDYDLFGKKPFLCLENIKAVAMETKDFSALLNGQKFMEAKKSRSDISWDYQGKALDGSCVYEVEQIGFFDVENPFKGTGEEVKVLNAAFKYVLSSRLNVGTEDQKLSFSFHIDDIANYIETLKDVFLKGITAQDFGKIAPEGTRLEIKDFSTRNKMVEQTVKGKFEKAAESFSVSISSDFKATPEWKTLLGPYHENFVRNFDDFSKALNLPDPKVIEFLKDRKMFEDIMPDFPSFGKAHFSVDLKGQTAFPFMPGEASCQFRSDLYDLGVKGALDMNDSSIKITVRNMQALMADLQNYVSRISALAPQENPNEPRNFNPFFQRIQKVLDKVLEPEGASEQSVDIHISPQGVKVGNYDGMQLMALLSQPDNGPTQ